MSDATITRLHPNQRPGYTDTAALNDLHALLTTSPDAGRELLGDVAAILARTGRPMVAGRDIDATTTQTPTGWPVARVDAGDTTVTVRQDPTSEGLLVEITTRNQAERDQLTVTLDSRCLHHARPTGGHAA